MSATAALGAVVTGGLMAAQPAAMNAFADAAESSAPQHTQLTSAAQSLAMNPVGDGATVTAADFMDSSPASTALIPAVVPTERESSVDKRDVEALHKGEKLAIEAAAAHAAAVKEANILAGGGDLDDWINVALNKLGLDQALAKGLKKIIMAESRGNPHAVNRTDSNAMAGRPSQGLMQTIPSTFRAYVLPELAHRPITDPVANITAGVRYMIANYGVGTLRAGGRSGSGGGYIGY